MWEPKSCCCGLSPRFCTLVIGWLSLTVSVFCLLAILKYAVSNMGDYEMTCQEFLSESRWKSIADDLCITIFSIAGWVVIFSAVVCSVVIIANGLMVFGVHKNKHELMIPYIVYRVMEVCTLCLAYVALTGYGIYIREGLIILFTILIFGLMISMEVYFLVVVIACYKQIKLANQRSVGDCGVIIIQEQHYKT